MKLYFAPGACSLSPHIVLREAGYDFELEQVDNKAKRTKSDRDYWSINDKGQVPLLELDDGERITEGPAIVQYLADQKPASGLAPPNGSMERVRLQEWLNFITSELHKTYGLFFRPTTPDNFKAISRDHLARRLDWVEKHLIGKQYVTGDKFTVADAYLFTILRWSPYANVSLDKWPNIQAYIARVAARPKVREAMRAEGLIK